MADGQLEVQDQQSGELALVDQFSDIELTFAQRVALDPTVDIERLNKIIEMEIASQDRAAKQAFIRAKVAAKAEMPRVLKGEYNQHTKSKYADLAAIDRAITPVITKHGFTVEFDAVASKADGHIDVTCRTIHDEGHTESFTLPWPLDGAGMKGTTNKTPLQAMKSTITFARRAMKMMAFDIADSDDDDGNQPPKVSGDTLSDKQVSDIRDALKKLNRPEEGFLRFMHSKGVTVASELESVPVESFSVMQATLAGFAKKQGEANDQ